MPKSIFVVVILCLAAPASLVQVSTCNCTTPSLSPTSNASRQEQTMNPAVNPTLNRARALDSMSPAKPPPSLLNVIFGGGSSVSPSQDVEMRNPFENFIEKLIQAPLLALLPGLITTTTTTTTTTAAPIQELGQNFHEIGKGLTSAMNAPIKVINGITKVSSDGVNKAADGIVKTTSDVVLGGGSAKRPIDDSRYYEYPTPMEPFAYRRSKYFSRECPFRVACEVGRLFKPFTFRLNGPAMASKFLDDLQNRYTRALTYGNLYGNCEPYYCVLVQLLGGPASFASGVSELVNRMVNSDQYEAGTFLR